jgi:hypothetical protein
MLVSWSTTRITHILANEQTLAVRLALLFLVRVLKNPPGVSFLGHLRLQCSHCPSQRNPRGSSRIWTLEPSITLSITDHRARRRKKESIMIYKGFSNQSPRPLAGTCTRLGDFFIGGIRRHSIGFVLASFGSLAWRPAHRISRVVTVNPGDLASAER